MQIKNIKTNVVLATDENVTDSIYSAEVGPMLDDSAIMIPAFSDYVGFAYQVLDNNENVKMPEKPNAFCSAEFFEEHLQTIDPTIKLDENSDWVSILSSTLPDYDIYELGICEHSAVSFSVTNIRDHYWHDDIERVDGILITARDKYTEEEIDQYANRLSDFYNGWIIDVEKYSLDKDHRYQEDGYVGYIYMSDVTNTALLNTPAKQAKAIKDFLNNLIVDTDEVEGIDNIEDWKLTQKHTVQITDFE